MKDALGHGSNARSVSVMQGGKMTTVEFNRAPRTPSPEYMAARAAQMKAAGDASAQAARDAFASMMHSSVSGRPSATAHNDVRSVNSHQFNDSKGHGSNARQLRANALTAHAYADKAEGRTPVSDYHASQVQAAAKFNAAHPGAAYTPPNWSAADKAAANKPAKLTK